MRVIVKALLLILPCHLAAQAGCGAAEAGAVTLGAVGRRIGALTLPVTVSNIWVSASSAGPEVQSK